MLLPPRACSSTSGAVKRRPAALLAGAWSPRAMKPNSVVDDAGTALHAGHAPSQLALNSAGLTPFALANAFRIGLEQARVGGRIAPPRSLDRRLVDERDAVAPCQLSSTSEIFPDPATPVIATSTPSGTSTSTSRRLLDDAPRISIAPLRCAHLVLDAGTVAEMGACHGAALVQAVEVARRRPPLPRAAPAPGPDVDHVVGDRDHLRLVLDDQHRIALVSQAAASRSFIRSMSCGCSPAVGSSNT